MKLPVVIHHENTSPLYLEISLKQCKNVTENVILLGSQSNKHIAKKYNCTHINSEMYIDDDWKQFEKSLYKRRGNSAITTAVDFFSFRRYFILKKFMIDNNITSVFFLDSDMLLLVKPNLACHSVLPTIQVMHQRHEFRMSAMPTGRITQSSVSKFVKLAMDIFVSGCKKYLIEGKDNYHDKNGGGRVVDMTIWYLLGQMIDHFNPYDGINNLYMINHIATSDGKTSTNTYRMKNNLVDLMIEDSKVYVFDMIEKKKKQISVIHCIGAKKHMMKELYSKINNEQESELELTIKNIKQLRYKGNHKECIKFYEKAILLDSKNIELHTEFCLFGYYVKNLIKNYVYKLRTSMDILIAENKLKATQLEYYKNDLNISQYGTVRIINVPKLDNYTNSTPSIIHYKDGYILNMRYVNYSITKAGNYICDIKPVKTINSCIITTKDFDVKCIKHVEDKEYKNINTIIGVEDIRLFNAGNDKIYAIGNVQGNIFYSEYNVKSDIVLLPGNLVNKINNIEKNWVIIPSKTNHKIIYNWYPKVTIGKIEGKKLIIESQLISPKIFSTFRGSTNGILVGNEIWLIVHCVHFVGNKRYYYHRFVILEYSSLYNIKTYSYPFTLSNAPVEYTLGFIHDEENDTFIISFSEMDKNSKVLTINRERVLSLLSNSY